MPFPLSPSRKFVNLRVAVIILQFCITSTLVTSMLLSLRQTANLRSFRFWKGTYAHATAATSTWQHFRINKLHKNSPHRSSTIMSAGSMTFTYSNNDVLTRLLRRYSSTSSTTSSTSSTDVVSSSLISHLKQKIEWSLEMWPVQSTLLDGSTTNTSTTSADSLRSQIANMIVTQLVEDKLATLCKDSKEETSNGIDINEISIPTNSTSTSTITKGSSPSNSDSFINKQLFDEGYLIAKALRAFPLSQSTPPSSSSSSSSPHPPSSSFSDSTSTQVTSFTCDLQALQLQAMNLGTSAAIADILIRYQRHLEINRAIYTHINSHHQRLATAVSSSSSTPSSSSSGEITSNSDDSSAAWQKAISDESSLALYASAATAMGDKQWVKDGYKWADNFAMCFFRRGGARKAYLNELEASSSSPTSSPSSPSSSSSLSSSTTTSVHPPSSHSSSSRHNRSQHRWDRETYASIRDSLARDLMVVEGNDKLGVKEARKIKILDVGSCYNPLLSTESAAAFEVTAIDLYPATSSVLQCDFLDLHIGAPDSLPVIEDVEGNEGGSKGSGVEGTSNTSKRLLSLPAGSFDVVIMSLVLSYLPTPDQRRQMISQARKLLKNPPSSSSSSMTTSSTELLSNSNPNPNPNLQHLPTAGLNPHDCGLLLIMEKESIFGHLDEVEAEMASVAFRRAKGEDEREGSKEKDCSAQENENEGRGGRQKSAVFSDKRSNSAMLINAWREGIAQCGFSLLKYRNLETSNKRTCHVFAFATKNDPLLEMQGGDQVGKAMKNLWIKQDFVSASSPPSPSPSPASSTSSLPTKSTSPTPSVSSALKSAPPPNGTTSSPVYAYIPSSAPTALPVGIVGGGLGGAALALALHRKGVSVQLFEKDASFDARKQGYALTMQQGASSLKALGLGTIIREEGVTSRAHISFDAKGNVIGQYGAGIREGISYNEETTESSRNPTGRDRSKHNVHIPRQRLRELLLKDVPPSIIQWNKKLVRFEDAKSPHSALPQHVPPQRNDNNENVKLHFEDGSLHECSVVVGADGIFSTVRQLLLGDPSLPPDPRLNYLGLMVILGISPLIVDHRTPEFKAVDASITPSSPSLSCPSLLALNCRGFASIRRQMQWVDGHTRVFTMPYSSTHTMWQLSYPLSLEASLKLQQQGQEALKEESLRVCSGWHSPLLSLISSTPPSSLSSHPAYDRDPLTYPLTSRQRNPRSLVTLLGDACHPMSPFKGQGANQALLDASLLSSLLVSSSLTGNGKRSISEALCDYEREMLARSAIKVNKSRYAAVLLHSESALSTGNFTRAFAAEASSPLPLPLPLIK